jgi:hypothetical protein
MYVSTFILFLLPSTLVSVAWQGSFKNSAGPSSEDWRVYCERIALVCGGLAVFAAVGFFLSWIYNGGSPHGLEPRDGFWQSLRPVAEMLVLATVMFGVFGKGRGRLFVVGSAISIFVVSTLLFLLEMD